MKSPADILHLLEVPADRAVSGYLISNADEDDPIDERLEEALRQGQLGGHSAWNFWGILWYEDGLFHSEILQYHIPQEILSAPTLQELMEKSNDKYGWD